MDIRYETVTTDRYPISVKHFEPDTPVKGVILGVHGFAGDKESSALQALAENVTGKGFALISFDLPAHGKSPVEEDSLTIDNCLKDLKYMADVCRKIWPNRNKYLFATSFGGFLTLLAAEALEDFNIILRAPAVTMAEHIMTDLLHMTPEEWKEKGKVNCGFERSLMLDEGFYEDLKQYHVMDRTFNRPMLIIHGDMDDVVPHEDILEFTAANPAIKLTIIKGADHRFKKPGEIEKVIQAAAEYWNI